MASTTWQAARREFGRFMGYAQFMGKDGSAWTTTTTITTDTKVISTEMRDAGFDDFGSAGSGDDSIENFFLYLLGTNNDRFVRSITAYDASDGQNTCSGVAFSAESGSVDFELHRYHPVILRDMANDARLSTFPMLHVPVSRYLFTAQHQYQYDVPSAIIRGPDSIYIVKDVAPSHGNNILTNGDFENYTSGVPDSWAATTLDTAKEVTGTLPFNYATIDGSATRCTSQTGSVGTLLQNIASPDTHSGQRVTFQIWVYCLTSGKVRTQIDINSGNNTGTTEDGGEHRGTGWELLTHFEDSLVTLTTLRVGIRVDSDATDNTEFYVDSAVCVVGPRQEPQRTPQKLMNWEYREDVQGATLRQYVHFPYDFPDHCLLEFKGKGYLSSVSAETDAFEVAKPHIDLLYASMANELYEQYISHVPDADRDFNQRRVASIARRFRRGQMHTMTMSRVRMNIPDWSP